MKALQTIWAELIGLFVDDWAFAGLALLWVGVFALPPARQLGAWAGPILFAGLAALALGFVVRAARKNKAGKNKSG